MMSNSTCSHDMQAISHVKRADGKLDITVRCRKCDLETTFKECVITSHRCEFEDIPKGVEIKIVSPMPYPEVSTLFLDWEEP